MRSEYILEALTDIGEEYIMPAQNRLGYLPKSKPQIVYIFKKIAVIAASIILVICMSFVTAMTVSAEFREIVFQLLHINQQEVVPEFSIDTEISIDNMYVEADQTFLDGMIEGRYVHTPVSSHAREGVYCICTDEIEMNQGSHYDAYYEEDGKFFLLEEHTFDGVYTVLENEFHITFDWVEQEGQVALTYIGVDENYRIPANPGPKENMLVELLCFWDTEEGDRIETAYPVLLDLTTGELKDVLAGTGAEELTHLANHAVSEDLSKMLLAQSDGTLYYVDLSMKKLYSIEEISGEPADACSLIRNTLTCWVLEENGYRAWTIDLTTFEREELFSDRPNAMGSPGTDEGIVYLSGFDTTIHWGTMFTGSYFALKKDMAGNVFVIDLATGENIPVKGLIWPAAKYTDVNWDSSPDGKRLLLYGGEIGLKYEYIGVLDFENMSYMEFSRENMNDVNEWNPYWFDKDTVIIPATAKDVYWVQDYYVYDILKKP